MKITIKTSILLIFLTIISYLLIAQQAEINLEVDDFDLSNLFEKESCTDNLRIESLLAPLTIFYGSGSNEKQDCNRSNQIYTGGLSDSEGNNDAAADSGNGILFNPSTLIEEHFGNNQITYKPFLITNNLDFAFTFQISIWIAATGKPEHTVTDVHHSIAQETHQAYFSHRMFTDCDPPFYPQGGTIPPGGSMQINVCFSSMELGYGTYHSGLFIARNAPGSPFFLPVVLHVVQSSSCLEAAPEALYEYHGNPPEYSTQILVLSNICSGEIEFEIEILSQNSVEQKKDNHWLTVNPESGTIPPSQSIEIVVGYSSFGLMSPGVYSDQLNISSNDPNYPLIDVPAILEIENCSLPPVEYLDCFYIDYTEVLLDWLPPEETNATLRWDDGINFTGFGLPEGGTFTALARFAPGHLPGFHNWQLSRIDFFPTSGEASFVLKVWVGENLMLSQPVPDFVPNQWNCIELNTPVIIDGSQDLYFGYEVTHAAGVTPAGCDAGPAVAGYGDLLNGGTLSGLGYNYNWNLAALLSKGGTLVAYDVHRNGELIATLPVSQLYYIDNLNQVGDYDYEIGAVYDVCISKSEYCTPFPFFYSYPSVSPSNFNISLVQGDTLTEYLNLSNIGHPLSSLDYLITIEYLKSTPEKRSWLSVFPQSGAINGNGMHTINVTINGQNLTPGPYQATIVVTAYVPYIIVKEVPVFLDLTLSNNELHQSSFNIYPNPTAGIFTIEGSASQSVISIFNAYGLEIYKSEQALPANIDFTKQPGGVYFIRIDVDEKVCFEKIIRN